MLIWLDKEISKDELAKKLNLKKSDILVENEDFAGLMIEENEYDFDDSVSKLSSEEKIAIFKNTLNDDDIDQLITDRILEQAYERVTED
jgi:hypothetical protein